MSPFDMPGRTARKMLELADWPGCDRCAGNHRLFVTNITGGTA